MTAVVAAAVQVIVPVMESGRTERGNSLFFTARVPVLPCEIIPE